MAKRKKRALSASTRHPCVELLRRYSNRSVLVKPLVSVLDEVHNPTVNRNETVTNTAGQTARAGWRAVDRLTEPEVTSLVEQYQDGATLVALAEGHKISRGAVRRLLQRDGIELRRRGLTPEQVDQAVDLYRRGWSLARIGEQLGVTANTVHTRLRERGVRMRNTHGRERHI